LSLSDSAQVEPAALHGADERRPLPEVNGEVPTLRGLGVPHRRSGANRRDFDAGGLLVAVAGLSPLEGHASSISLIAVVMRCTDSSGGSATSVTEEAAS